MSSRAGKPLNGEKTHPLSEVAKETIRAIRKNPIPCSMVNPGVANRLEREGVLETKQMKSPFKTHKGKLISFYCIKANAPQV
jgi:hypothetical protein